MDVRPCHHLVTPLNAASPTSPPSPTASKSAIDAVLFCARKASSLGSSLSPSFLSAMRISAACKQASE